jgi:hypothetical protein
MNKSEKITDLEEQLFNLNKKLVELQSKYDNDISRLRGNLDSTSDRLQIELTKKE